MDDIITKIEKIGKNKYLIYINDEAAFALYYSDIKKCSIKEDMVIDPGLAASLKDILYERGLKRALYLVRSREHTAAELTDKLCASYYPLDTAKCIVEKLKAEHLLDDTRFARMYIEIYGDKKPALIVKSELKKKGIEAGLIDDLYDEIVGDDPDTELKQCLKLLETKFPLKKYSSVLEADNPKDIYTLKTKAMSFLARKGFSFDAVSDSVKEYFDI